jgi:hypothetical protein
VDGVERVAHIGTLGQVCKGAGLASYRSKFGPRLGFFWLVSAVVIIRVPVGGGGFV